jgi:hypothetical protein
MKRLTLVFVLVVSFAGTAAAAPIQIDFNVAAYGPLTNTVQTFTKIVPGLPTLTFDALDQTLLPAGLLHWDANDGNGFSDGFGVRGFPGAHTGTSTFPNAGQTYANDEIEANERLRLTFSSQVRLLQFMVTDFFYENEATRSGIPNCTAVPQAGCYQETGEYSLDGGLTWTPFTAATSQNRAFTNGVFAIPVNQMTTSLLLRAPGRFDLNGFPYPQLHDFSLAAVVIEEETTPEPAALLLFGTLLSGFAILRRRARRG